MITLTGALPAKASPVPSRGNTYVILVVIRTSWEMGEVETATE